MTVTKIGLVSYSDDPHKRVFRVVYPERDDSELDQPPTDGNRQVIFNADGSPSSWASFGVDGTRTGVLEKVSAVSPPSRFRGTPWTAATEPIVYWVNADTVLASLNDAQATQMLTWLAANPQWSNNFVDLGSGDVATLTTGLVSPCWIVVVGGGTTPAVGTLQRSVTVKSTQFALWTA